MDWSRLLEAYLELLPNAYGGILVMIAGFLLVEAVAPVPREVAVGGLFIASILFLSYADLASTAGCVIAVLGTAPTALHLMASALARATSGDFRLDGKVRWRWNRLSLAGVALSLFGLSLCF